MSSAKRHFRYVILPPTVSTKITLSRMTAALAAMLVMGFDSRSESANQIDTCKVKSFITFRC